MEFALANLCTVDGERAAVALPHGYFRLDRLASGFATSLRAVVNRWDTAYPLIIEVARQCETLGASSAAYVSKADAELATPIRFPNKLVCVGAVYKDHLREFNLPAQRWPKMPMFLRPPTTSIVGPGAKIAIPPGTAQFDWEIELAVVMGARLTDANLDSAKAAIAGYCVGVDLTCRDLLDRDSAAGIDLVRAKAQDDMAPVGPMLMPAEFVGDPQQLGLRLYVNGEIKQNGTTSDMLYSVYEQVATISRFITLEPGDIVFTGSCAGSGASIGQFLKPGDRIRAEIDKVGCLEVEIAEARRRPADYREVLHA
ncbi:fumarylacetoacetate hydrolase family protein [Paraburkholderia oxyphila]|uniref:fumarylacetoacetate hydrolase family protein n=1 Tax=Paraburkholderia oxyphila TaxID=614212 RepID=UPI0006948A4D|nr:fumarylacetoacetate hydrolase family protein [Paraburkholderia oxyphila]